MSRALSRVFVKKIFLPMHEKLTHARALMIFTNRSPLILIQGPGSEVLSLNFEVVNLF